MKIRAAYYQQFDADPSLEVPGEGYGGWQTSELEFAPEHTAVVVMHAWDWAERETYPGWYRAVEYIPRAQQIYATVFPRLLAGVRASGLNLFHVVGGGDYYKTLTGYHKSLMLAGPEREPSQIPSDPVMEQLRAFRAEHVFVGKHNEADVTRGFENLDFPDVARPLKNEAIAASSEQLFELCRETDVNHLIYTGFALDGCLLMSPGGMIDMIRHGIMCSCIREAVTAIENRETARQELGKQYALWRVGLLFGFVFGVEDFLGALTAHAARQQGE